MPKLTVSIDGVAIKDIELTKERTTLGRRPYNDIVIDNLAVSGEHAVFLVRQGRVEVEDLNSTNGTYLNGKAVRLTPLQDQDTIEIGKYRIRVSQDDTAPPAAPPIPAAPEPAPAATARIQVINGPAAGREMALVKVVTTLGKPGVSVAAITRRGSEHTLSVVEGHTAPTVNGAPVGDEPVALSDQDLIELADTQMRFLQP
jgi:hypothetical protein